jgi:hypothetical protein
MPYGSLYAAHFPYYYQFDTSLHFNMPACYHTVQVLDTRKDTACGTQSYLVSYL